MSTMKAETTARGLEARILQEGYGNGAWHGPDLRAALKDVTSDVAFWRPADARHNIAEIALHHAYCARGVVARLTGLEPEPFVLEGEDWFTLEDESKLSWPRVLEVVEREHERLAACIHEVGAPRSSGLGESERLDLVLGVTCHAIYHAGQVQLIKRLVMGSGSRGR